MTHRGHRYIPDDADDEDSGAPVSLADLFTAHGRSLVSRARRVLRDEAEAEDVVQDVMLSLLSAPHLLATLEKAGAWLVSAVVRRGIDRIRRASRRRARERAVAPGESVRDDPSASLADAELAAAVDRAIDALPPDLRSVLLSTEVEGLTFRELSAATDTPMGTLMARKQRAMARVRETLQRQGFVAPAAS